MYITQERDTFNNNLLWYCWSILFSKLNNDTIKDNHSSLAPTHLLDTNISCQIPKPIFKTLNGEKRKTLVSFVYALISGIWTSFIMVVVHNRVPNAQK